MPRRVLAAGVHPGTVANRSPGLATIRTGRCWLVRRRIKAIRRLLDDSELAAVPGVSVRRDATSPAYAKWAPTYDDPDNGLFAMDEPIIDEILDRLPVGDALDAACGTGRLGGPAGAPWISGDRIDGSNEMLEVARTRLPGARFSEGDRPRRAARVHIWPVVDELWRQGHDDLGVGSVQNGRDLPARVLHQPEHGPVLREYGGGEVGDADLDGESGELLNKSGADPATVVTVGDFEGDLCMVGVLRGSEVLGGADEDVPVERPDRQVAGVDGDEPRDVSRGERAHEPEVALVTRPR